MIKILYIGKRKQYTEGCYGSKILFEHNKPQMVPYDLAMKLLKHPDQYKKYEVDDFDGSDGLGVGETPESSETPESLDDTPVAEIAEDTSEEDAETDMQDIRDSLSSMDRDSLADFAFKSFSGFKLDKRKSEDTLRLEVVQMLDQVGLG